MQLKLQKRLRKMNNQTEIEDIEKLKKKVDAQKAMKIFITPGDNGFNVAIDIENSKNMNTYIALVLHSEFILDIILIQS